MKDDHEFDWLPPLDGRPGPALEQSAAAERQAIQAALHRAGYGASVLRRAPRLDRRVAVLGLALTSLAAAGAMVSGALSPGQQRAGDPAEVTSSAQQPPNVQGAPPRPEAPAKPEASAPAEAPAPASPLPPRAEHTASSRASAEAPAKVLDPLREANLLRGRGQWRAAHDAYLEIVQSAPGSADAYTALAAAAALKLERLGDARGALELYQKLVRQGGYLGHQARFGEAASYRALGDAAGERRSLEDLVALAPEGRLRRQALHRLSELRAR